MESKNFKILKEMERGLEQLETLNSPNVTTVNVNIALILALMEQAVDRLRYLYKEQKEQSL